MIKQPFQKSKKFFIEIQTEVTAKAVVQNMFCSLSLIIIIMHVTLQLILDNRLMLKMMIIFYVQFKVNQNQILYEGLVIKLHKITLIDGTNNLIFLLFSKEESILISYIDKMSALDIICSSSPKSSFKLKQQSSTSTFSNLKKKNLLVLPNNDNNAKQKQIDHDMFQQFSNNFVFRPFQYPQILQQKLSPPYKEKLQQKQQIHSYLGTASQTSKSIQSSKQFSQINQSCISSKHKQTPLVSTMFNSSSIPTNSIALSNLLGRTYFQLTHNLNNFYSFCMLLFPQHSKCLPIDIEILDTIFFQTDKDLVYVYKDSKKGLIKIRNKNKKIYQFFKKRKNNYQFIQKKQNKQKIINQNNYFTELNTKKNEQNSANKTTKSLFCTQSFKQGQIPDIIKSLPKLQFDDTKYSNLVSPDNTRRKNYENQQLNYIALLKYKDNSFLRLKQNQFKAIFLNPLYANQRFKNHNNTQYIQYIPQQNPNQDIKAYSMHFAYQTFCNEQLFKYVINCCGKQNQYLSLQDKQYINQQKNRSNMIKEYLKHYNEQVYLYYLVFQIYAYISMHYNKKLEAANFKFIKYDQIFALSSVQNIILNSFQKEGDFLKVDLFHSKSNQETLEQEKTQRQLLSALSTPALREVFNKNLLKTLQQQQNSSSQNLLQKHINSILQRQNTNIKEEFVQNIHKKLDRIKNTKDTYLSKNVFKLLNPNIQTDFHQMLNNQKKLKKLLIQNDQNLYSRKNISNFSVVRSLRRSRPSHSFQKNQNIFQSRTQTIKDFLASTAATGFQTSGKFKKIQTRKKIQKRKELNKTYVDFNKTNFKFTGLKNNS